MIRLTSTLILLAAASAVQVFAAADAGLLALLPADTQTVAGMNVDASRSSTFGQFVLRQMAANDKGLAELTEQTGFDPRRDLQSFVIGTVPATGSQRFLLLARGIFDQPKITARATSQGMVSQTVAGTTILTSTDHSSREVALAFPETGLAAFGDRASVEQALRNRANPVVLSSDLQKQINGASSNDAWFASTVAGSQLTGHIPTGDKSQQAAQAMQAVTQSNGGIRFGDTVQLSFNALTRSEKDAVSLTDVIRFVSSTIQMQRDNDPRAALLAPSMDSIKLRADGRNVYSSIEIPEASLEEIVAISHGHRPARTR